jgi:hypothetical protein
MMRSVQLQLADAEAARDRIEAPVWVRNPEQASLEGRKALLPYLMTEQELVRWRSIEATIEEMRKHLP